MASFDSLSSTLHVVTNSSLFRSMSPNSTATSPSSWSPSTYTPSRNGSLTSESNSSSPIFPSPSSSAGGKQQRSKLSKPIVHPYARLEAKKSEQQKGLKRRKVWDHLLEKRIFSAEELSKVKAQDRRKVYITSLEAHVDYMHSQLLANSLYPVPFERLDEMSGLHSKTAMAMISGVLHDTQEMKLKLLELERTNRSLRIRLKENINPTSEPVMKTES